MLHVSVCVAASHQGEVWATEPAKRNGQGACGGVVCFTTNIASLLFIFLSGVAQTPLESGPVKMASLDAKACKEPFVKMNAQTQNGLSVCVNICMHSMYKNKSTNFMVLQKMEILLRYGTKCKRTISLSFQLCKKIL